MTRLTLRGLIVSPGFIDIHVHCANPARPVKRNHFHRTAAASSRRIYFVCAMPNTNPVNDAGRTRWMQDPERGARVNVFPIAAPQSGSMGDNSPTHHAQARRRCGRTDDGNRFFPTESCVKRCSRGASAYSVIQHAEDTRMTKSAAHASGPTAFPSWSAWPGPRKPSLTWLTDIHLAAETKATTTSHIVRSGGVERPCVRPSASM